LSDTAFLTGATGFVGANLARLLLEKGYKVRALARKGGNRSNLHGLDVEIIEGDLSSAASLSAGCAGARYAFHVAADYRIWVNDPQPMYEANVQGTVNVVTAASEAGCERVVYCSSVAAVRPPHDRIPATEESQYSGVDEVIGHYKKSKYLAEQAALHLAAQGAPVVIVNPAAPIGAYDIKPTPTGRIVLDFIKGRMPSYIDTGLNVVDVRDAALGHYLAALKGRVGQRYILGGENLTLKQVLDLLAATTGLPAPRFQTPYVVAYLYGAFDSTLSRLTGNEPRAPLDAIRMAKHYMWFDSSKAKTELGYAPQPARPALESAVAWFTR
jgi:dihydroflavonol-4-reductase